MKTRATNPARKEFPRYSALGVHQEWLESFESFFEHVGPRVSTALTLERIDNSVGYFPGNVQWSDRAAQARNTKRNVTVRVNGEPLLVVDAAKALGVSQSTVSDFVHGRRKSSLPGVSYGS